MADLETQVVKIQLGDKKQANSYVYTLAETVDSSQAELFMICELPLFNPAAADECERIAQAIAASLRRSYRRPPTANTFENALTVINEELGKLQNLGKTHWLGKLNSVIAVKFKSKISITSVGKITALLYREGNFAPIAESSTPHHPLKTFENFSEGKVKLDDLIVLSTSQMFNHISIDRFKSILKRNDLPDTAQEVIGTLQDAMGPEAACGTILAKQVEAGTLEPQEETDLGAYMAAPQVSSRSQGTDWLDRLKDMSSTAATIGKNAGQSIKQKIKTTRPNLKDIVKRQDGALQVVQSQFKKVGKNFQPDTIKGYSMQKKIFMIAAAVLLIAVIANVAIAKYFNSKPKVVEISQDKITSMEKLLSDANSALLYGDESQAKRLLADLQSQLNGLGEVAEGQKNKIADIRNQANSLDQKLNKVGQANVETLGTLSNADNLIVVPTYFATESNRTVVSYNRNSKEIKSDVLRASELISMSSYNKGDQVVIYNGSELQLWNYKNGVIGGAFSDSVPGSDNARGLTVYNGKAYLIDRSAKKVMKYTVGDSAFSAPSASVTDDQIANATDITIDGSIYVLTGGNILKFNSGAKQEFNSGVSNLPDSAKLYTENGFTNLYVMDPSGKRIVILGKDGKVVQSLANDQFNDMKDFYVDEKGKAIYILNNNQLLKATF